MGLPKGMRGSSQKLAVDRHFREDHPELAGNRKEIYWEYRRTPAGREIDQEKMKVAQQKSREANARNSRKMFEDEGWAKLGHKLGAIEITTDWIKKKDGTTTGTHKTQYCCANIPPEYDGLARQETTRNAKAKVCHT